MNKGKGKKGGEWPKASDSESSKKRAEALDQARDVEFTACFNSDGTCTQSHRSHGTWVQAGLVIKVSDEDLTQYLALRQKAGIDTLDATDERRNKAQAIDTSNIEALRIRGFLREGRSFGGATAFKAQIGTEDMDHIECAILIPDLTRHVEVIEVIAEVFLRETLDLTDGNRVSLNLV